MGYLPRALPPPGAHRLYFDHGTLALDSLYPPFQERVDDTIHAAAYVAERDWVTRVFSGAGHSERAWRLRVQQPLIFLL